MAADQDKSPDSADPGKPGGAPHEVSPDDLRDVRLTLDGQADAYARIVRRYQQEIAGRMWRFTRDRAELDELVHDVFVEAYMSLAGYRGQAPLVHWLQRIATRVGYRSWKRKKVSKQTVSLQDWDAPEEGTARELAAAEAGEVVHKLLAQLPPRDRLVLTLLYLEELPVAEAARRAGWSQVMTKVQAHRARKKLKVLLEKSGLANATGLLEDEP